METLTTKELEQLFALLEKIGVQAEEDQANLSDYGREQVLKAIKEVEDYISIVGSA